VVQSGGQFAYCSDTMELRDTLVELTTLHPDWNLVCYEESLCRLLDGLGIGFSQPVHTPSQPHYRLLSSEFLIAEEGAVLVAPGGPNPLADQSGVATLVVVGFTHQLTTRLGQALQLWVETHGAKLPSLGVLLQLGGQLNSSREIFVCLIEL
jgi:hypothetical protein